MQVVSSVELLHTIHQQWREGLALDLSGIYCTTPHFSLQMADHSPVDLSQGNYTSFCIEKATFSNVNFQSSTMTGARFHACTFFDCDFSFIEAEAATFTQCLFINATFYGARLIVSNFTDSRFYSVCFNQANLYGTHLIRTRISGPFPGEIVSNMAGAIQDYTPLTKPFLLPESTAVNTNMTSIQAQQAVLSLDLTKALLLGADLTGAYLVDTGLKREDLLNKARTEAAIFTDARDTEPVKEQIRLLPSFWATPVGFASLERHKKDE